MKYLVLNILFLLSLTSCRNDDQSKQFSLYDLHSTDLHSTKLMDDCYYLNVFDEKCLEQDKEGVVRFRFTTWGKDLGTEIVSVYSLDEKEYIIVRKSIEATYDSLFGIIVHKFPIKYNVLKSSVSKIKFAEWRSSFITLLNSNSTIVESHDRDVLKVEYREGTIIKSMELRGELSDEIEALLDNI